MDSIIEILFDALEPDPQSPKERAAIHSAWECGLCWRDCAGNPPATRLRLAALPPLTRGARGLWGPHNDSSLIMIRLKI